MSTSPTAGSSLHLLPSELVDWFTKHLTRFLRIQAASGVFLLLFAVAAVILSNSPWAHAFEAVWETQLGFRIGEREFDRSLRGWINDGAMTLFFFLVALELKRALVLGELRRPRVAALSIAGALGGMIAPAGLYLLVQWGRPTVSGWGTVMATDTAFVIGCLALLGSRIPQSLRVFMLSLAIVDDIGAILVVAIGYSDHISWSALGWGALVIIGVRVMALIGIRSLAMYFAAGGLLWLAMDASGIHATVTGVLLGLLTPARRWVSDDRLYTILSRVIAHPTDQESGDETKDRQTLQLAAVAARETLSPVERLEVMLHPWVGFLVMPLFAFANAGFPLSLAGLDRPLIIAMIIGFVIGKPLGILSFCWVAIRTGIATRPVELNWRLLAGGGALAGIGFTMALFIANLAFPASLLGSAKLGIFLASIVSAAFGLTVLILATRGTERVSEDHD